MADSAMEDTRQRIIDAALILFGQVGYTRASTRAIAEQAGVNEVTLFRHFCTKKNLLMACVHSFNQIGFSETFQEHLTGHYPDDILMMARLQIRDTQARFEGLRLLLCEAQAVPEVREAILTGADENRSHVTAYFEQQIDACVIRADLDVETLTYALFSLFSSFILLSRLLGSADQPSEEQIRTLVSLFVQGTLASQ
jgi:AcrR family transcriptional regulator